MKRRGGRLLYSRNRDGEKAFSPLPSLCKGGCRANARREGCKSWRHAYKTTLPSCLRQATSPYTGEAILRRPWQATVSAAQGERRLRHGFCPQWQKPQFAARARHTVAMRIMRGSPPCTGEANFFLKPSLREPPYFRRPLEGAAVASGVSFGAAAEGVALL